jgi:putative oxidoreductase
MFRSLHPPDLAALVIRVVIGAMFLTYGGLKITESDGGTSWYVGVNDTMSPTLQATVAWTELLCGLGLLLGLFTRLAAFGIVVIMLGAIARVTWHFDYSTADQVQRLFQHKVGYEYNVLIITLCVAMVILGGGLLSLDHWLFRPSRKVVVSKVPEAARAMPARSM